MDSPAVTQLFRQLLCRPHPACLARRSLPSFATALHHGRPLRTVRALSSGRGAISPSEKERAWQRRTGVLSEAKADEAARYPLLTARELRGHKERPRRVKMLMRDFIEGECACLVGLESPD